MSRESDKNTPVPPPPLPKDEGLKDIGHSMSIGNLILGADSVTVSYLTHLICYDSLLQNIFCNTCRIRHVLIQNATEVYYKYVRLFITKCDRFITKCDSFITNCDNFITKSDRRCLLQIATVHPNNE